MAIISTGFITTSGADSNNLNSAFPELNDNIVGTSINADNAPDIADVPINVPIFFNDILLFNIIL